MVIRVEIETARKRSASDAFIIPRRNSWRQVKERFGRREAGKEAFFGPRSRHRRREALRSREGSPADERDFSVELIASLTTEALAA